VRVRVRDKGKQGSEVSIRRRAIEAVLVAGSIIGIVRVLLAAGGLSRYGGPV
jgi:hypothetical protein